MWNTTAAIRAQLIELSPRANFLSALLGSLWPSRQPCSCSQLGGLARSPLSSHQLRSRFCFSIPTRSVSPVGLILFLGFALAFLPLRHGSPFEARLTGEC